MNQKQLVDKNSVALFARACKHLPGGVNSPVRAFKNLGRPPLFMARGQGARLYDTDNNAYIDYIGSWGALIHGHAHRQVIDAVAQTAQKGTSFGTPTELEVAMAEKLCALMPALEMVRMVNSGTEATMSAIRLARAYTGRKKIIKFEGCYHGHADSLLASAGSGMLTLGIPESPGVTAATAANTIVLEYNDQEQLRLAFEEYAADLAAVIVEPIAGNMNFIPARQAFLEDLRRYCTQAGSLLIFDEVMTGFRVALGGAQSLYKVTPDLVTLGKVIGGGLPVGAFGGRREIVEQLAPIGQVYQAGTLSGNPLAMVAGLTTLGLLETEGFFNALEAKTQKLCDGLLEIAQRHGISLHSDCRGGMFGFSFSQEPPTNYRSIAKADQERFKKFYLAMLARNIYLAPSAFEAGFVSSAHSDQDIADTLQAAAKTMAELAG